MKELYGWIRNLTGYFLFMSVLDNLLPGRKYTRYIRLFSGMVLILLVLQPLTGSLRLEERIAHYYESFVFQYQADDLKQEILGVEKQQLKQLIRQYEQAVEQDVQQMAEDAGYTVESCRARICSEQGTESFGTVTGIQMRIEEMGDETGRGTEAGRETEAGRGTEAVGGTETVEGNGRVGEGSGSVQPVEPVEIGALSDVPRREALADYSAETGILRRKIASYYNLEESYVEIQVVERER